MNLTRTALKWDGGLIEFDLVETEDVDHDAEFTDYPVEEFGEATDGIIIKPDRLNLVAYVSNAPLPKNAQLSPYDGIIAERDFLIQVREPVSPRLQQATGLTSVAGIQIDRMVTIRASVTAWNRGAPFVQRVQNVYDLLLDLRRKLTRFTVTTHMRDYDAMCIEKLKYHRDRNTVLQPRFDISLKKLNVSTLQARDVSGLLPKKESTKVKKDRGKQAPVPADAKTEEAAQEVARSFGKIIVGALTK